jgi:hypothetical protein
MVQMLAREGVSCRPQLKMAGAGRWFLEVQNHGNFANYLKLFSSNRVSFIAKMLHQRRIRNMSIFEKYGKMQRNDKQRADPQTPTT